MRLVILNILTNLFLNSSVDYTIILNILYFIGMAGVFKKCGLKWQWVLVPCYREYQLARCAGRESEGRGFYLSSLGILFLNILSLSDDFMKNANTISTLEVIIMILAVSLTIVRFIYNIRVLSGLIEVYGLRKRWIGLCLIRLTSWYPLLIWGWNKKYQPEWQVEDIQAEMARLASSGSATVMDEGLTVNLKDRTVREFFQKKTLLRDIHMSIPQGHMVLLLGGSGAGKTTFLNAVNGYEKANAEVLLNGTNMYKQYRKMQYEVGFVPQSEMMRGKDTVLNTLLDAAKLYLLVLVLLRGLLMLQT